MKYFFKQLFCIHDFYHFPVRHRNPQQKKYNYIRERKEYVARDIFQVIRKCLKCDKEKIYKEYFGYEGSEALSIETAKALNGFRGFKNNQFK